MLGWIATLRKDERGQGLVLAALAMVVIMGFAAMAVDAGSFYQERRGLQNAADAAALAGAQELPQNPSAAVQKATEYAGLNEPGATVQVTTPYQGDATKIEVRVSRQFGWLFGRVLGMSTSEVAARAVATLGVEATVNAAILTLNETECQTFDANGSLTLTINNGGAIVTNSSCDPSIYRNGSGTVSADGGIYYYEEGGYAEVGSGALVPTPDPLPDRIEDPLAGLVPPNFTTQSPNSGGTPLNPQLLKLTSGTHTLQPGVYYGGIEIVSSAGVTLQAGTYVMAGGGFKIGGSATVIGNGITIYNSFDPQKPTGLGACEKISLAGSASYNLVAPTSGPYKDILFWQDPACTNEMSFNGNGDNVGGVIYLPTAGLDLSGNAGLGSIQVIADTVEVSGNGNMSVNFYPYLDIPVSLGLKLVE